MKIRARVIVHKVDRGGVDAIATLIHEITLNPASSPAITGDRGDAEADATTTMIIRITMMTNHPSPSASAAVLEGAHSPVTGQKLCSSR